MSDTRRKKLNLVLIVLGLAIIALSAALFLAAPAFFNDEARAWAPWGGYRAEKGGEEGSGPALDQGFYGMARGHRGFPMMRGSGGFLGGFLLLLAILAFGAVFARRGFRHGQGPGGHHGPWAHHGPACGGEDALSVLRREFAEGKISAEEFKARKAALEE